MPPRIKTAQPVQHDARLTLVEHLDELRSRLIFCVAALTVIFAVCVWQNDALLKILNQPLADTTQASSIRDGSRADRQEPRLLAQLDAGRHRRPASLLG